MPEFNTLAELLMWIAAGGGAAILVGRFVAYFLENLTWWHNLPPLVKRIAVAVVSVVFGILAEVVLEVDLDMLLGAFAPIVSTLILAIWNWLASQAQYARIKDTSYAESARPFKLAA